jgi:flavodoxin
VKVLVTYKSDTGSTKKVAEAIYEEIGFGVEKELKSMADVTCLDSYDLSFVGFPIQQNGIPAPAKQFFDTVCQGKKTALFITHAAMEGTSMADEFVGKCREAITGVNVIASFDCQGELNEGIKQYMLNSNVPALRDWASMDNSQGQPDASRIEAARVYARDVMAAQR